MIWQTSAFAGGWMADGMWIWCLVGIALGFLFAVTLSRLLATPARSPVEWPGFGPGDRATTEAPRDAEIEDSSSVERRIDP